MSDEHESEAKVKLDEIEARARDYAAEADEGPHGHDARCPSYGVPSRGCMCGESLREFLRRDVPYLVKRLRDEHEQAWDLIASESYRANRLHALLQQALDGWRDCDMGGLDRSKIEEIEKAGG